MSNIKITIEGVEKEFKPIDVYSSYGDLLFKNKWYREVENVKQDYEILSFGENGWVKKLPDGKWDLAYAQGNPFTLEQMLGKVSKRITTIHSVKRLSDGEVFIVGEQIRDFGTISKFIISDFNEMILQNTEFGGYRIFESAEKVKQPTILKEPVKQDYEILSFKVTENGNVWKLNEHGLYSWQGFNNTHTLLHMLKCVKEEFITIHSVKRLTDGEVFSIRDKEKAYGEIKFFLIVNEVMFFGTDNVTWELEYAVKVKQPTILLTTEDGKEITESRQWVFCITPNDYCKFSSLAKDTHPETCKTFSTEAARDEYILQNKPVRITYKELFDRIDFDRSQSQLLTDFFKSKQNSTI